MQQHPQQPVLVFCITASEDVLLLKQWETHLLPLQQAGHITIWSDQHLLAGDTREQINEHLVQADIVVLLLSSDFFASKGCYALMEQSLQRYQSGQVRVIPLLLRPVTWHDSPLASLPCLPSDGRPISSWSNQDEGFHDCVKGICTLLELPIVATPAIPKKASIIDAGKTIAQLSFTTLAAVGNATSNALFTDISALPHTILEAFDFYHAEEKGKRETLVLLAPIWWSTDTRSWDNFCEEVNKYLPAALKLLFNKVENEASTVPLEKLYRIFADILVKKRFIGITGENKKRIAEYIAPLILQKVEEIFNDKIDKILKYRLYLDIKDISRETANIATSAVENAIWLQKIYGELTKNHGAGPSISPAFYAVTHKTLASLTPQKLLETEAVFKNPTMGKELLEVISKLIERFEEQVDQIIGVLSDTNNFIKANIEEEYIYGNKYIFNLIVTANRKLITISNEMRSIYRNLDKKFILTSHNRGLIDHITSVCAQISECEGALIISLKINPFTLQEDQDALHYPVSEWVDFFLDGTDPTLGYHLTLIDLNNYKIALREAIDSIDQTGI